MGGCLLNIHSCNKGLGTIRVSNGTRMPQMYHFFVFLTVNYYRGEEKILEGSASRNYVFALSTISGD